MNPNPIQSHFGDGMPLIVEPIGSDDCTALSLVKVAYSQTKNQYDVGMLWNATPQNSEGANPLDTIKTAITRGLFNISTHLIEYLWTGYFDCTVGISDAFTNTVANMNLGQSSAMINGSWYSNWNSLQPNEVMPHGDIIVSSHSFVFVDWVVINGVTMAKIDAHQGHNLLMPQDVFNAEVAKDTVGCLMPSNPHINSQRTVTVLQWIQELFQKISLLLS